MYSDGTVKRSTSSPKKSGRSLAYFAAKLAWRSLEDNSRRYFDLRRPLHHLQQTSERWAKVRDPFSARFSMLTSCDRNRQALYCMLKSLSDLYLLTLSQTHSEWNSGDAFSASAGSNVRADKSEHAAFKRLPFTFCALSLQPFTTPVCTAEGIIFDHENIIRWLIKHDTNPVDGKPLKQSDLIKLNFAKNDAEEFTDPVTYKVLTDNTHIVAIRHGESANAFAYDTVERLNIKPKMWKDLISDVDFSRQDIITLQDPQNLESRNLSQFQYLKNGEDSGIPKEEASVNTSAIGNAKDLKIMQAKDAVAKAQAERNAVQNEVKSLSSGVANSAVHRSSPTPYNATRHTNGQAAASFTSTGVTPHTSASLALMSDEEFLLRRGRVKHKGYVRLRTSLGELMLELYPEYAPKAVYNFVRLVQKKYYDGIVFHRNMKNFMIQGGDPTGTGKGGSSIWSPKAFEDEFDGPLKHDSRGVLSMANKGKDSNTSQFFISYRKAPHLDRKHTIFGKMVEGEQTLKAMEEAPVDDGKRPEEDIEIFEATVFVDPFEEFWKTKKGKEDAEKDKSERKDDDQTTWTGKRIRADGTVDSGGGGVGRYMKQAAPTRNDVGDMFEEPAKKKAKFGGFGNFDSW